jgi:cysteine peptidase C11 family protein
MAKPADWAVLVYISADDILTNFAVETLKQLKLASGGQIVAAAQVDKNGERPAHRFRFPLKPDEIKDSSLDNNRVPIDLIDPNIDPVTDAKKDFRNDPKILKRGIAEPINLTKFVDWASIDPDTGELIAERFCVVAWGHGVELLLDEDRLRTSGDKVARVNRRYLTPVNLRKGLEGTRLLKSGKKFDIIGLDACSMSMVELASELPSCADFMVASQEDVPDISFPYLKILDGLKREAHGKQMEGKEVSKTIGELYLSAYRDYIAAPGSGVRAMTLSSLNLSQVKRVTDPLRSVADGLLAVTDPKTNMSDKLRKEMFKAILDARRDSRSFVFGLFVDLFNFCEQLNEKLGSMAPDLSLACSKIREEITEKDDGFVIKNAKGAGKGGKDCHGLSIYFPYRDDDDTDAFQILQALGPDDRPVKGGNRPAKGGNRPAKERTARIEELETDFDQLSEFKDTNWMQFIKQGWSRILTAEEPENLDLRYSGQQVAKNLAA